MVFMLKVVRNVVLTLVLISLTAAMLFVNASGADAGGKREILEINRSIGSAKYFKYSSAGYSSVVTSRPASVIVYFHDSDESVDTVTGDSLIADFFTLSNETRYKDFQYIVVAPQRTQASWVKNPETFSDTPSNAMLLAQEIVADVCGVDIVIPNKHIIIGVGDGATAAYDYVCRNPEKIGRVLTVGGKCDAERYALAADAYGFSTTVYSYPQDGGNADAMKKAYGALGTSAGLNVIKGDLEGNTFADFDAAVKYADTFNEPTLEEWAISEAYSSLRFTINSAVVGNGGVITPAQTVLYGQDARFTVTVDDGYAISKFSVNGKAIDLAQLKKSQANASMYTYVYSNVTAHGGVQVEFTRVSALSAYGDVIDGLIKWCTVIAVTLVVAAAAIFVIDRTVKSGKKA